MNILVLGSEGQIGKPFCELAKREGHNVIHYDIKLGRDYDLRNQCIDLDYYISKSDVVVFLAFDVGGSKYLKEHDKTFLYISNNVRIMEFTFSALSKSGKPFLFASSQMANMHHTNYGFLKDLGERYTKALGGWTCRFWNVYGYEDKNDPKSHVITDFIKMALEDKHIQMRTKGYEKRQFLHATDAAWGLLLWCETYKQIRKNEYLDITSFKWNSIREVAHIIQDYTECMVSLGENEDEIQGGKRNEPSSYYLDFWSPAISLENGIKGLIGFYGEK